MAQSTIQRRLFQFVLTLVLVPVMLAARAEPLVLVTSNYPPFSYEESNSQKGIAVDLVKEAFSRMNQPIKIQFVPFPRAISMIKQGEADAIFPFAMAEDRKTYSVYPKERLINDPATLFVRANSDIEFDGDYAKLAKYKIGMQRGTNHGPVFMRALTTYNIAVDEAIDQEQNIQKLVAGRFDIAIGPHLVVMNAAKRIGLHTQIKALYSGVSEGNAYVGFSKKKDYAQLIEHFNRTIKLMEQDGSKDRIVRKSGL